MCKCYFFEESLRLETQVREVAKFQICPSGVTERRLQRRGGTRICGHLLSRDGRLAQPSAGTRAGGWGSPRGLQT